MSYGPVSGNGISINLKPGVKAYYSGMSQAQLSQYIRLNDSNGNTVFELTGLGPWAPQSFTVDNKGTYTVYIGTNGGQQWSQVIWDDDVLTAFGIIYCQVNSFVSEDAGDQDFNDTYLSIYWFQKQG